jgi:hypothetical protein
MRRFAPFTMPDPGVHNAPIQLSTLADMRTAPTSGLAAYGRSLRDYEAVLTAEVGR